jgi:hypothetical protein
MTSAAEVMLEITAKAKSLLRLACCRKEET